MRGLLGERRHRWDPREREYILGRIRKLMPAGFILMILMSILLFGKLLQPLIIPAHA